MMQVAKGLAVAWNLPFDVDDELHSESGRGRAGGAGG